MNTDKVLEFYKHALSANKIDEKMLLDAKNILSEVELKSFIQEKLLPIAQELGYDITIDDLLAYEKEVSEQLSEEDLENITGGVSIKAVALGGLLSIATLAGIASFDSPASAMHSPSSTYGMQSTSASIEDANARYVQGQGTLRCTQNPSTHMWILSLTREGPGEIESVNFYASPRFSVDRFLDDAKTILSRFKSDFKVNNFTNKNMICKETAIQGNTVNSTIGTITVTPGNTAQSYSLNLQRANGTSESVNFASKDASFDTKKFLADAAIALQMHPDSTAEGFVTRNSDVYLVSQEATQPSAQAVDTASTQESNPSGPSSQTRSLEEYKTGRDSLFKKINVAYAFSIPFGGTSANDFVVSPDDKNLAYSADAESDPRVALKNADGTITILHLDSGISSQVSRNDIKVFSLDFKTYELTGVWGAVDTASSETKSLEDLKKERKKFLANTQDDFTKNDYVGIAFGFNWGRSPTANDFVRFPNQTIAFTVLEDNPRAAQVNPDGSVTVWNLESGESETFSNGDIDLKIIEYTGPYEPLELVNEFTNSAQAADTASVQVDAESTRESNHSGPSSQIRSLKDLK